MQLRVATPDWPSSEDTIFAQGLLYITLRRSCRQNYYQLTAGSELLLGKKIRTLIDTHHSVGTHQVKRDGLNNAGTKVTNGIYFYQIEVENEFVETKKMVLMP
ncbi:MAG: hypothetical protein GWN00_00060 [Aliifodinibius sp.]|nr:hypothetical protein [Fodinibius sp.]NIV09737.1 hypothetical protein [Fodinibius sp.]NIY23263.1 hypothetical protein [Fodinibius sp.]